MLVRRLVREGLLRIRLGADDEARRPLQRLRAAREERQVAELAARRRTSCASRRASVNATSYAVLAASSPFASISVVDAGQARLLAEPALGGLDGERVDRTAAVVVEGRCAARSARRAPMPAASSVDPSVVEPLGQAHEVAREPVAADVRRLPGPLRLEPRRAGPRRAGGRSARSTDRACRGCRRGRAGARPRCRHRSSTPRRSS